jgi:hypothetical protein
MWREPVRPFTVFCLWAIAVACANLNERPAAPAGGELSKAAASTAPEQKRAAPVPRQRLIIKDRPAMQEPVHRTFDREREEQYEEEEQQRGRARHREE